MTIELLIIITSNLVVMFFAVAVRLGNKCVDMKHEADYAMHVRLYINGLENTIDNKSTLPRNYRIVRGSYILFVTLTCCTTIILIGEVAIAWAEFTMTH